MGLIDSPYHSCQAVTWDKCIPIGDRLNRNNPFAWEKLVLKFLGTEEYDCHRTWVLKKRADGFLTADLFVYVDDGRPIGPTEDL